METKPATDNVTIQFVISAHTLAAKLPDIVREITHITRRKYEFKGRDGNLWLQPMDKDV